MFLKIYTDCEQRSHDFRWACHIRQVDPYCYGVRRSRQWYARIFRWELRRRNFSRNARMHVLQGTPSRDLMIGRFLARQNANLAGYTNIDLDELLIWNRILDEEEIAIVAQMADNV